MRTLWFLLTLLPLCAAAGPAQVISVSGTDLRVTGAAPAAILRQGDLLEPVSGLQTGAASSLQVQTVDGATLALGEQSRVQLDADQHAVELQSGRLALWSEKKTWDVRVPQGTLRGKGFLRLRLCDQTCAADGRLRAGVYGRVDGADVTVEYRGGRVVLRNRLFLMVDGGRPELLARDEGQLDAAARLDVAQLAKQRDAALLQQALEDFRAERLDLAQRRLTELQRRSPGEPLINYYLGLIALQQQRNEDALRLLQLYSRDDPQGARERDIGKLLTLLTSAELQAQVQRAVAQEKEISAAPPEPGSIAVQAFSSRNSPEAAVLAKGIAAMVISDLSQVPGLKVLEREKVQKISDELRLKQSGLVDADSAIRVGRLMRAERVVVGNIGVE